MLCKAIATQTDGRSVGQDSYIVLNSCLPSNFPDPEEVWKMEIKSGRMVKSVDAFFYFIFISFLIFFFKATSTLEMNFIF